MVTIDGLATGLDTTSIIESILSIQKAQVDRFTLRKETVSNQKEAFKTIEAKLLGVQLGLGRLMRTSGNAFEQKTVTASDTAALTATVSNQAAVGNYSIRVNRLAANHQVATQVYDAADAEITQGSLTLQVGTDNAITFQIDDSNDNLAALAATINSSDIDASAAVVRTNDGYRLLLSSNRTGVDRAIQITDNASLEFDVGNPVQAAADAEIQVGSGNGAIVVTSDSNTVDDMFTGMTLNLQNADPDKAITLTVNQDTQGAKTAINDFVTSYNEMVDLIAEATKVDVETGETSILYGNRAIRTARDRLTQVVGRSVPGIASTITHLSRIGISQTGDGKLSINDSTLDRVLSGQESGITMNDVRKLFGYDGQSSSPLVSFVQGSPKTVPSKLAADGSPYEVVILRAAEQATVQGVGGLAGTSTIDDTNDELSLEIDGRTFEGIKLSHGTYDPTQLADMLERKLNSLESSNVERVRVGVTGGRLEIQSLNYGKSSTIGELSGSSLTVLGLSSTLSDTGEDVIGHFKVDGKVEKAEGRGRILTGNEANAHTAGLQVRSVVTKNDITTADGFQSTMSFSRGVAAELNAAIDGLLRANGTLDSARNGFDEQIDSIDDAISRLTARFDAAQASLIKQFTAMESAVSNLQSLGSLLGAQLSSLPRL